MLKTVEHILHFSKKEAIKEILKDGLKPSYAQEKFNDFNALMPMISFSNILLRDVGDNEILAYGDYAICFTREWGISKGLNPVNYTHEEGILKQTNDVIFNNTFFLKYLEKYKEFFVAFSKTKTKISKEINFPNLSKDCVKILDHLSSNYDEELFNSICNHSKATFDENLKIALLMKNFKVSNKEGEEFIAYNDREWRKIYPNLGFIIENTEDVLCLYYEWLPKEKPHFHELEYRLTFGINDLSAVMVSIDEEKEEIKEVLISKYGNIVNNLINNGKLHIGTKEQLIKLGF